MELKSTLTWSIFVLLSTAIITLSSCEESYESEEDCYGYTYFDCETSEPFDGTLDMYFTISPEIIKVPFEIYKGTVDKGELIIRDTAWNSLVSYTMTLGSTYSVRAKYTVDNKTIYAIDGGKMDKTSESRCDSTCWDYNDLELRLNLQN